MLTPELNCIQQVAKFYSGKGGLADNSPNFPTTKVSLHTAYGISSFHYNALP